MEQPKRKAKPGSLESIHTGSMKTDPGVIAAQENKKKSDLALKQFSKNIAEAKERARKK
jgi:hypothetical protein